MGWLIVIAAAALFIAMEARRQKRRRAVRAFAVPVAVAAGKQASWWPAIVATHVLGPFAYWVVWRDMARDEALWFPGFDSMIAIVAFAKICCAIAPSRVQGAGSMAFGVSLCTWMVLICVMIITADGPAVLADFNLIANDILTWAQRLFA